jgi:hypothetical protein
LAGIYGSTQNKSWSSPKSSGFESEDICGTIALAEWVVSAKPVSLFARNRPTGAEFKPILNFKNAVNRSERWFQLRVTGMAGNLAEATKLGNDPFGSARRKSCGLLV